MIIWSPFVDYLPLPYQKPNSMLFDQFFEHIKKQYHDKLPFVAYRKPHTSELKAMLQGDDTLHSITDFNESGFVFAPFDSREDALLIPLDHSKVISAAYDENKFAVDAVKFHKMTSQTMHPNQQADKRSHIKRVKDGIEAIENDCFSKVVLSRREILENVEISPIIIFKRLLHRYPTTFVYIWYHPKIGLWLGATPETLLCVSGSQLKTMALAGTQSFEGSIDVVWKEKEKEEQQIVTDFIVESLESVRSLYSTGVISQHSNQGIKVSSPKTVRAGNLLHLQTEISMQLDPKNRNLKPILDALHPTPAVCGFPKEKAKAFIIENEGYDREFYAGFLGELHLKETISRNTNRRNVENNAYRVQKSVSELFVNLRCMQIKNQNIFIYVGGGITKDSDAEAEWEETIHKSKIIKSVL